MLLSRGIPTLWTLLIKFWHCITDWVYLPIPYIAVVFCFYLYAWIARPVLLHVLELRLKTCLVYELCPLLTRSTLGPDGITRNIGFIFCITGIRCVRADFKRSQVSLYIVFAKISWMPDSAFVPLHTCRSTCYPSLLPWKWMNNMPSKRRQRRQSAWISINIEMAR
jgi:hypothetical protein